MCGLRARVANLGHVTCSDCGVRVEHCHGTLVRHTGDVAECTEPDCTVPEPACHTLVVHCVELDCTWCVAVSSRHAA